MGKFADLHIHTYFSDSSFSPADVVREALHNGLFCIAITDHDTLEALPQAREAARDSGLEVLPGIELSCELRHRDIHILAYLVDIRSPGLQRRLSQFQETRIERINKMVTKLKELGVDNITTEEVMKLTQSDAVGRPHLAALLVEKGWVPNLRSAFERYLAEDRPAYVSKFKQTPQEAISLIHEAGGVAVLAHPVITAVDELIPGLAQAGLDGLEVYYPNSFSHIISYYEGLARKHDMIVTGGSDAHGEDRGHGRIGQIRVPYEAVEALKKRKERYG